MRGGSKIGVILWISLIMCVGSGCGKPVFRLENPVRSAALIPFFVRTPSEAGNRFVEDPMSGRLFLTGEIVPNARRELTDLLYEKLTAFPGFRLVSVEEVERAMKTGDFARDPMGSAQKIGDAFGVDGVVLGWVFRYEERIGSAISVERPASVSFVIHLFGVKEGRILWRGIFQETQQPLSENVLKLTAFLRRRGAWLRVRSLASVGMDEILDSFPASRERLAPEGA